MLGYATSSVWYDASMVDARLGARRPANDLILEKTQKLPPPRALVSLCVKLGRGGTVVVNLRFRFLSTRTVADSKVR